MTYTQFIEQTYPKIADMIYKSSSIRTKSKDARASFINRVEKMLLDAAITADKVIEAAAQDKIENPMSIARPNGKVSHDPIVMTPEVSSKGDDVHQQLGDTAGQSNRGIRIRDLKLSNKPQN